MHVTQANSQPGPAGADIGSAQAQAQEGKGQRDANAPAPLPAASAPLLPPGRRATTSNAANETATMQLAEVQKR